MAAALSRPACALFLFPVPVPLSHFSQSLEVEEKGGVRRKIQRDE